MTRKAELIITEGQDVLGSLFLVNYGDGNIELTFSSYNEQNSASILTCDKRHLEAIAHEILAFTSRL